ncbi:nucleotidyltransferase family protein [Pseudoduganella sp. RAF53_2]|uniref:nucleotidyltransferase family protein n=1 Tax=unclassified Pseudoduganella TaxID=2637179 RepID=UPI003F9D00DE
MDHTGALIAIARRTAWFMDYLRAARELRLQSWCVGAGAVRTLVWDALHGVQNADALPDIDLAYFDAFDLRPERDAELARALGPRWEAVNQAAVHRWYPAGAESGLVAVAPLASLTEAIATWPEYATCVGIWLDWNDTLHVIAPHGLDDLFGMVIRHNPARATAEMYRARVAQKRYAERWLKVQIMTT